MKYAKTYSKLFNKNKHMRFIFLIITLVIITYNANSQTKSIDLYDLIRSSVPDSSSTENVTDWQNGISINPLAMWVNNKPKKSLGYYYKDGGARLKPNNKKFEHVDIFLRGNTLEGYSEIRLHTNWGEGYAIEKLIGNKPYTITLLKKDVSGLPNYVNDYYYELKLPGKKEVWVISESNINRNDNYKFALYIRIIFDYEAFKSEAAL
jgi:hypothetical protein